MTRKKKNKHVTSNLKHLHCLPITFCCKYKVLLYVFKALKQEAPVYFQELVKIYKPTRTLQSENNMLLVKPTVRTKTYGERRFDRAAKHGNCECFQEKH